MFTVLELIAASVVFGILTTVFTSSVFMVQRMKVAYTQEHRAILLLDNIVERLAHEEKISVKQLKMVVNKEFKFAQFPRKQQISITTSIRSEFIKITVYRKLWSIVASIRIKRSFDGSR